MKRSKHNLSNYKLLSCDMGELVPIGLQEVLPGDSFSHSTSALVRVSPLLAPVMHPVHVKIHHWFVPHRLVWEDWEKFITGGPDGMDASVFPTVDLTYTNPTTGTNIVGALPDYLGVPPGKAETTSALPFRGYALIWNEWYRDQDLQTALPISKASGPDAITSVALQNIAWEKDYFTTAREWTQKGPEITVPLGSTADVISNGLQPNMVAPGSGATFAAVYNTPTASFGLNPTGAPVNLEPVEWGSETGMQADLSTATAATINELRVAFALQRYEEARARYGSRYVEYLRYLGVRSSDARLQRPEYLGGGKQTIQFSEVLQTAQDASDPLGTMGGHGIGALKSNRYKRFFEEHGYVFTFLSVKPKTMYAQGLARTWNRRTKEDFFQKELQHIGQQEVLYKELYTPHATPNGVFGYQDRYDEYRRTESSIGGEFRTTQLDFWHMARLFSSDPALNASFIKAVPTKRINAVQTNDVLWIMAQHKLVARRLVDAKARSFIE